MLSSLEAHWHVLEAEVVEINRDIEYCEQCLRKYGEWFNSPLQYLRVRAASVYLVPRIQLSAPYQRLATTRWNPMIICCDRHCGRNSSGQRRTKCGPFPGARNRPGPMRGNPSDPYPSVPLSLATACVLCRRVPSPPTLGAV